MSEETSISSIAHQVLSELSRSHNLPPNVKLIEKEGFYVLQITDEDFIARPTLSYDLQATVEEIIKQSLDEACAQVNEVEPFLRHQAEDISHRFIIQCSERFTEFVTDLLCSVAIGLTTEAIEYGKAVSFPFDEQEAGLLKKHIDRIIKAPSSRHLRRLKQTTKAIKQAFNPVRDIHKEKILNAMRELLRQDLGHKLDIKSVANHMQESRATLYRWAADDGIDLDELKHEAEAEAMIRLEVSH